MWISMAEQRASGLTAIADSIRTVRIQMEELKVCLTTTIHLVQ